MKPNTKHVRALFMSACVCTAASVYQRIGATCYRVCDKSILLLVSEFSFEWSVWNSIAINLITYWIKFICTGSRGLYK